jgi:F0F1-type ATP synthase membrane subunit b/b'
MTNQTQSRASGIGRILGGLLRLILFAVVVALITGAVYLATPYVYRYTMLPVQNNRAVIETLRQNQAQLQEDVSQQLAEQRERIAQLEADLAAEREARSELENQLAQQGETLAAQAELAAEQQAQGQAITGLEESIDALDLFLNDLDTTVAQVEQDLNSPDRGVARLQAQTLVLQMQQATLKSRLHLTENNAGQAQQALEQAQQALETLNEVTPSEDQGELAEIEAQLEAVSAAIEEQPFIAIQELEILWQMLQEFSE